MTGQLGRLKTWWVRRCAKSVAKTARAERLDTGIGAEFPIRTASQDRLRRVDFADRIAEVLSGLTPLEGRVFAIRGGWGFGKSSLKNLISERLDAEGNGADWLDFNPWQWGDSDAIARALFGQIADQLGSEHSQAAIARAAALRRYGAILTGASAPLKKTGETNRVASIVLTNASVIAVASAIGFNLPTVAIVATVLAALSIIATVLGHVLSHFGRDRSNEPLDKIRDTLEAHLRVLGRPLIVFVDDIDRLEPEQIRMLLRQVKANANLPNIVFVLLFQPSIVERALDPISDGQGRAFLEKIVQTSFDLPVVPASVVHRIFGDELTRLVGHYATEANGFSQARWGNSFVGCIQPMLRNLRDARRLISSIEVHMPMHVADHVFEVNVVDFIVLESLRVFEPDLHQALFRERELVLQESRFRGVNRNDGDRAAAEQLLEIVPEGRRAIARDTLIDLFPTIEWAYGGTNYGDGFAGQWLAAKRVCSARYFPRYFELQTSLGEISERRFVQFLNATSTADDLDAVVAGIEVDGLLPSLVARFDESVDRLPVENAAVLLPAMFRMAQKLAGSNAASPFHSPWISAWRATNWFLRGIPEGLRGGLVLDAFRQTEALSIASILIHLSDPSDREEGSQGTFDPVLDINTVEDMKVEWLRLMRQRAEEGNALFTEPDLVRLLYRWGKYAGALNEPREWVSEAIRSDGAFAAIVASMMNQGTTHSWGDRVAATYNFFNKENIEELIGLEVAMSRCDAIDASQFPEYEEALRTLRSSLELWLGLRERTPDDHI